MLSVKKGFHKKLGPWLEYTRDGDQSLAHFRVWGFYIEYARTGEQRQLTIGW